MFDLNEGYKHSQLKLCLTSYINCSHDVAHFVEHLSAAPIVLVARHVGSQTETILKVFDCVGEQRLHSGAFSKRRLIRRALPHCYLWLYLSCSLCSD